MHLNLGKYYPKEKMLYSDMSDKKMNWKPYICLEHCEKLIDVQPFNPHFTFFPKKSGLQSESVKHASLRGHLKTYYNIKISQGLAKFV